MRLSDIEPIYHGTSDLYLADIKSNGLRLQDGKIYVTTNPFTARVEAYNTVAGDYSYGGYPHIPPSTIGVGGIPIVIVLDRALLGELYSDPEYFDESEGAFFTTTDIPAAAIQNIIRLPSKIPDDIIAYWQGD